MLGHDSEFVLEVVCTSCFDFWDVFTSQFRPSPDHRESPPGLFLLRVESGAVG